MARKKVSSGAPAWVVTFGDMMSLLLCFFIVLLSFSVMDEQKFVEMAGSLERAFGVQKINPYISIPRGEQMVSPAFEAVPLEARFQAQLLETLEEELKSGMVETEEVAEGLIVRVRETIAFPSGSVEIREDFKPILDKLGKTAAALDAIVMVSGHTDDQPLKQKLQYGSNWSLSAARAVSVIEYWLSKHEIPAHRLAATGHAEGQPIADNTTPEGRSKNRRVEFKFVPSTDLVFKGLSTTD